jgi:hypothetical protein
MEPHDRPTRRDGESDPRRDEALARYDAHPGIAIMLLAVMAFLFIVIVYQFASDRVNNAGPDRRAQIEVLSMPSR